MDHAHDANAHQSACAAPAGSSLTIGRQLIIVLLMTVAAFATYLINVGQQDFTNASEAVVIEAALEARRGGPWWVPNMHGRPRILKPPLATWIAAAAMSPDTVAATQTGSAAQREAASRQLAAEARWPFALTTALTIVGTWWLASIISDGAIGLAAAAICVSTLLLFRFGRMANTDIPLTLWVVMTNASLAMALLRGHWWKGCLLAGIFLGLVMMSKGPVGIIQSVLPAAAFAVYRRIAAKPIDQRLRVNLGAIAGGIVLLVAIAVPWYIAVALTIPNAMQQWYSDVFAPAGTEAKVGHWWGYISLIPNFMPWAPLLIAGLCLPLLSRIDGRRALYAWFLFVVPIIVMSFFRDKNERYGMPMVPAASILSAFIAVEFARNRDRLIRSDRLVEHIQWLAAFIMALAPLVGAIPLSGNPPFYSWSTAILISSICIALVLVSRLLWKRAFWTIIAAPAVVSLIVCHCAMLVYTASSDGRSEYKPLALRFAAQYPQAQFLFDGGNTGHHTPVELAIYAGRIVWPAARTDVTAPPAQEQILFAIRKAGSEPKTFEGWTLLASEQLEDRPCNVYYRAP